MFSVGGIEDPMTSLRKRFWIEIALSGLAVLALVMTFVNAHWLETLTGLETDGGSGISEWTLTLGCVVFAVVFALACACEWRRTRIVVPGCVASCWLVVRSNCGSDSHV